jgi:hypothetical protein
VELAAVYPARQSNILFAAFAVKAFDREDRKECRQGRKELAFARFHF